ncbi:hypothetical protein [Rhizobium sp. AQ_MP]|uniref:hypothetical protein n=1 Tax=Rhizobium sp. AQ_MP TaxID=2761536 RepID=UPI001FEED978|nr:hypothetical protein [Rhizobium sp. AQ_MP]
MRPPSFTAQSLLAARALRPVTIGISPMITASNIGRAARKTRKGREQDISVFILKVMSQAVEDHSHIRQSRLLHGHHFGLITIVFCPILKKRPHLNHA